MKIRTFQPLIPASNELAQRLTCPPYDVVSKCEAANYVAETSDTFMSVIRPDATLNDVSPYDDAVYAASKKALDALRSDSKLVRDSARTLYVYQQTMNEHVQTGLVTLANVRDYDDGVILKHEKTRKDKEDDRTKLTDVLSANTGPVFLTYRDDTLIDDIISKSLAQKPLFDVEGKENVKHTVWRVSEADAEQLVRLFDNNVERAYIADGHHRSASAARVARNRVATAGENCTGDEDFSWFLAVLFPQTQLQILPYNRIITDLNGHTPAELLDKLSAVGEVSKMERPQQMPEQAGTFFVYVGKEWYKLLLRESSSGSTTISDSLDCSLLQNQVLQPILDVQDPRSSKNIEFVGGIRGLRFLEKRADATNGVAFALHAVTVAQLMQVSDMNEIMPPKSTWFEPKLRSGFFIHTF